MPDQTDFNPSPTPGVTPQRALQDLPLLSPPRSAWPALQASLDARRTRTRPRWQWLAAAAALALAALLPRWLSAPIEPAPVARTTAPTPAPTDESAELRALMAESAQLETLIAWSRAERVESAVAASLSAAVQDRIEHVDALLARADADPEATLPLWQERVVRLRQLAGLESTQQLLAANGDADQGMPVLAF